MRSRPAPLSATDVRAAIAQKAAERDRHLHSVHPRPTRTYDASRRAANQVHALGVGRKIKAGQLTDTACVRFYVTRKLPKALLHPECALPVHLNGVPTDVIEAPLAYFAATAVPPVCSIERRQPQRPLCPGISAANEAVPGGTLGALCRSTIAGEEGRYLLGCRHTFQDPTAGSVRIFQPSPGDGGTLADEIARFARSGPIEVSATANNTVDAAIALLTGDIEATARICGVGMISATAPPALGAIVHKHGRTSGYTVGQIDDPSIDVLIPESDATNAPVARFVNQFRIQPAAGMTLFAQTGDSGALIVERKTRSAMGLLFACPHDRTYAYANPISEVLGALQIRLELAEAART